MSIDEIITFDLPAISKTIREYTTDNFIQSYASQLLEVRYPQEQQRLYILVTRLLAWYDGVYDRIKNDPYVHSRDAHFKSHELLKKLFEMLCTQLDCPHR
jgi:hypothetical protein